jgi:Tfp pilus assembly protein PilF
MTWRASSLAAVAAVVVAAGSPMHAAPQGDRARAYYHFLVARHLAGEAEIDRAAAEFREAARLDPASAEIRAELAALYAREERTREAAEWGEAALKLDPSHRGAHRVLGFLAAADTGLDEGGRLNDPARLAFAIDAIRHLEAARRPDRVADVPVELTLARLYLRTGVPEKAVPVLLRMLTLDPDRPGLALMLAEAHEAAGQLEPAADTLRRAVAQRPRDAGLLEHFGDLLFRLGRYREALGAWERALAAGSPGVDRESIERKIREARAKEPGR